ncbi:MAG: STAS domain-containing protein [Clostridia bacterium]|nr:STAS domain-containing protein [Clostridia bacterium]
MVVDYKENERTLTINYEGDIDHHSCLDMAAISDNAIKKYVPKKLVFDFKNVNFMDSAGIGMVIRKVQAGDAFWW